VTSYSGYGTSQDQPGELDTLTRHLLAVNQADGKILWDKTVPAAQPEQGYEGFIGLHGYASSTPATDGHAVYVFFGRSGVVAFSMSGEEMWRADVGAKTHGWGSAASPVLWKDLVIVNASIESQSLVAFDKAGGKQAWRVEGIRDSWSTPALVDLPGGRQELVVSLHSKVLGLNPATGEKLWECVGVKDYVCPAVVSHEGIVYITAGRKGLTLAIRAGGKGDVTGTHVLWELGETPKVATPLYREGRLYWISNAGVATCVDAKTGKTVYKERLPLKGRGDKVYASPVLAGDKIIVPTREDGVVVLGEGPVFNEVSRNRLDDPSIFNATPAVAGNRLFLRSDRFLYCIGK
jgi:outer membrane protein assembly factor BamB